MTDFDIFGEPTRAAGLSRLAAFAPRSGAAYRAKRNHDLGPGAHSHVSRLSPYLRRRLVTEEEAARAALAAHGLAGSEKFVLEVFWRTYWKGWLELRPSVWSDYRRGVAADRAAAAKDRSLTKRLETAEDGRTGIDAFDAWAQELVATGYLHNHARMWFASIWIFTLELPWRLGADFFLRRLLDGDPASNTLSWRWVAGLHTRGKHYVATADNIRAYTGGRFETEGRLAQSPRPLSEPPPPAPTASGIEHVVDVLDASGWRGPKGGVGLLATEDEGAFETLPRWESIPVRAVATLALTDRRSDARVSEQVAAADQAALDDAATRAAASADAPVRGRLYSVDDVIDWARSERLPHLAMTYAPVGWTADWAREAAPLFDRAGLTLHFLTRRWDRAAWPHASAGFFSFKEKIPTLLQAATA